MDVCRRKDCGHPGQSHQHYRTGSDCSQCLCLSYQPTLSRRGRWHGVSLALTLAAAALTGWALALLTTGYTGPLLFWLGLAALGLVVTGSATARRAGYGAPR